MLAGRGIRFRSWAAPDLPRLSLAHRKLLPRSSYAGVFARGPRLRSRTRGICRFPQRNWWLPWPPELRSGQAWAAVPRLSRIVEILGELLPRNGVPLRYAPKRTKA